MQNPRLFTTLFFALTAASATAGAAPVDTAGPLAVQSQGSFFVGGTDKKSAALNGSTTGAPAVREGTTTTGQMYVQYQIPVGAKPVPIVLIHGGGLSGQGYETTPDGRMGWNEYLLRSGRAVYNVDQAGRGRSGFDATGWNEARLGKKEAKDMAPAQIIGHEYAWEWFRIGPKFGEPYADTQFPVAAVDQFYKMWIPDLNAALPANNPSFDDLAQLGKKLGGAVLIGHSESFMFPERAALVDPKAVKGIISLESGYACETPYSEQDLKTLAGIPMLIVFADHQADAPEPYGSRWVKSMALCRDFAANVKRAGGDVTFLHLPEIGIHGNTHMMMLDKNNLQVADLLIDWINTHVQ